jgi:hypothetical protein
MVTIALVLSFLSPPEVMSPSIMMFHGGILKQPVFVVEHSEIFSFLREIESPHRGSRPQPEDRPYVNVSFFWGAEWTRYVTDQQPLSKLRPDDANQHGRFYPALRQQPAVLVRTAPVLASGATVPFPKDPGAFAMESELTAVPLAFLQRHGVPVGVER